MNHAREIYGRVRRTNERVCIIRTRDGVKMELRGADAPSVASVLLFFKRLQTKRAKVGESENLSSKQRMARDLNDRLTGGDERSIPKNQVVDLSPWWQKVGSLQVI
jgi:hypothetical protein